MEIGDGKERAVTVHDVPLEGSPHEVLRVERDEIALACRRTRRILCVAISSLLILLAIIIGLSVGLSNENINDSIVQNAAPTATVAPTTVMSRSTPSPVMSNVLSTPSPTPPPPTLAPTGVTLSPVVVPTVSMMPSLSRDEQFIAWQDALIMMNVSSAQDLMMVGSPQYLALDYMIRELYDSGGNFTTLDTRFIERYVAHVLYHSTGGPISWRSHFWFAFASIDTCFWNFNVILGGFSRERRGILCNANQKIAKIHIPFNNLTGTIPTELALLTDLTQLSLPYEDLYGTIPSELQALTQLTHLGLYHNRLSGTFPEWIPNLTLMQEILLSNNLLEGALPDSLTSLRDTLTGLAVDDNMMNGDNVIPIVNRLNKLNFLHLDQNEFSGTILSGHFLVDIFGIKWLDLSRNQFVGEFPGHLLDVRLYYQLEILDLHGNQLGGTIPDNLPAVINNLLQVLALHRNSFNGTIPTNTLKRLHVLRFLDLSSNMFTGVIPSIWSSFPRMNYLFLADLDFLDPAPIPKNMLLLAPTLVDLSLKQSQRTGTIPEWLFTDFQKLRLLDLDANHLNGTIPTVIGQMQPSLSRILLNRNELTGPIPTELGSNIGSRLQLLLLEENNLTGSLDFMCRLIDPDVISMIADCLTEVECNCCALCCQDGQTCHNSDYLYHLELDWEAAYTRGHYGIEDWNVTVTITNNET